MKNQKMIIVGVLVALVFGSAGFFGGVKYQQMQISNRFNGLQRNAQNNRGNMMGFRSTNGQIISVDDGSITVKMTDGSSKIVMLSATTTINRATAAAKADLKVGGAVTVFGQTNSDGSVTAANISSE